MEALSDDLSSKLADVASDSIAEVVETQYTHTVSIDDSTGVYDCDCSGFVEHLLSRVALRHLVYLRDSRTTGKTRPLARDFYDFFASLDTISASAAGASVRTVPGWSQIPTLTEAGRGDMLAWSLPYADAPDASAKGDTGHVMVLSGSPTRLDSSTAESVAGDELGPVFAVSVYDASEIRHYDDSRGTEGGFDNGIGTGTIHVDVDAETGKPLGFRFHQGASRHAAAIAIGNIKGFDSD